jgi:hypothetical protein
VVHAPCLIRRFIHTVSAVLVYCGWSSSELGHRDGARFHAMAIRRRAFGGCRQTINGAMAAYATDCCQTKETDGEIGLLSGLLPGLQSGLALAVTTGDATTVTEGALACAACPASYPCEGVLRFVRRWLCRCFARWNK